MTATITANNGAGTVNPLLVLMPYEYGNESRNVIHDLIGGGIVVSLVAPRPRSGSFDLLFADNAAAVAAAQLHREETTFTLTWPDLPTGAMTYVTSDSVSVRKDPVTLKRWIVTVGYQEVTP
jgi:hypothetical protein